MSNWHTVQQISNWGYWDSIRGDSEPMTAGRYRVRWADGSESDEDVLIHKGKMTYRDMGTTGEGRDEYAYVRKQVNGVDMEVKLAGLAVMQIEVK